MFTEESGFSIILNIGFVIVSYTLKTIKDTTKIIALDTIICKTSIIVEALTTLSILILPRNIPCIKKQVKHPLERLLINLLSILKFLKIKNTNTALAITAGLLYPLAT